ncbi:MAG: efflux RND transporter periplasmic adaptor subunit [Kordiimonadaceae bacterium]|nr:efflux RND transporter periplasmic adaptor subunit [Kordiimonadaceae bacterium]MBO6567425.1 efflux RND transporter periplasmic adaptor subunit [Kordiimonadaceae bacterium]MBO6963361.1 efflux RND transporter periplasmic adaptor subunit [Kordiimonadaceae bacterium]
MNQKQPLQVTFIASLAMLLVACGESNQTPEEPPVRGLRVFEVSAQAESMERRFPSLVQPADETPLSFEISGQLSTVDLEVGQRIVAGDTLTRVDETTLRLELQQSRASLEQAEATLENSRTDFQRKAALLETGNVTQAAYDTSQTNLRSAESQADQALQQYAISNERLEKAVLRAPFDGIISEVNVRSFSNITAGQTIVSLYSENAFEVEFSVPATVINELSLGDVTEVEIADLAGRTVSGRIKELGSRAGQVSAFPVVVALEEELPGLKAGMSADVAVTVGLVEADIGFLVPLNCFSLANSKTLQEGEAIREVGGQAEVFVFDPESSTVSRRTVYTAGIRENLVIVVGGLSNGELIASAGVSYLSDGQKVRRLPAAR